jgi:polyhydroxybutyrate depolymerase
MTINRLGKRKLSVLNTSFLAAFMASCFLQPSICHSSTPATLTLDGVSRLYYVYVPSGYAPNHPAPLMIVLHPFGTDAAWAEAHMGWDRCADQNGFIVVYGQSGAKSGLWNAQISFGKGVVLPDDVDYLKGVMSAVETTYSIDLKRVYMVGFSSGAIMAAKMAAAIPGSLTAIGTVEGMTGYSQSDQLVPTAPVSAIMFRGTADHVIPYVNNVPSRLFHLTVYGAVDTATDWARADGCLMTPVSSMADGGNIAVSEYTGGKVGTEIKLMTVNQGHHVYAPQDTGLIWQFFISQSKLTVKP